MVQGNGSTALEPRTEVDRLVDRLNEPGTAAALNSLLDNADLLATLVAGLDGVFRKGDLIADTVTEVLGQAKAAGAATGLDYRQTTEQLATLIPAVAKAAPAIHRVVDSGLVEPEPVAVLSEAAQALVAGLQAAQAADARVSTIGLLKAMRDEDVQRGLGFAIAVLKIFGREMTRIELPAD
jgi:hypothetical protein